MHPVLERCRFRVISLNTADEVNGIRSFAPDVDFLEIPIHHRPLITDFFTAAAEIDAEIAGIINADCLLIDQMGLARRLANHLGGLAVVERFNVDRNTLHPTGQTCFGFDAFFFTTAALPAIECNASWRIGDNWWDYWLPLTFYFAGFEPRTLPLIYLPKYSPDFNPIELAFSKLKAHLRKAAEHTILRLPARIGRIVTDFSRARMQELLSSCVLCSNLTGICSNWLQFGFRAVANIRYRLSRILWSSRRFGSSKRLRASRTRARKNSEELR